MIAIPILTNRFVRTLAVLMLVLYATACGDSTAAVSPEPQTPPAAASISIAPQAPTLVVGERAQLVAVVLSANGEPLRDRVVQWRSEAEQIATVAPDGVVTAIATGAAELVATSGRISRRISVAVSAAPPTDPAAWIIFDMPRLDLLEGREAVVRATVRDAQGNVIPGRVITWETENAEVATVDADGRVHGANEGSVRLVARHGTLQRTLAVRVNPSFGGEIVYDAYTPGDREPRLFRMDIETPAGSVSEIFPYVGTWEASVSPDGTRLAFTCTSDGPAICVSDIYGYGVIALTISDRAYEDQPSWSPDGKRIAFRRWPQGATPGPFNPTDIWVMNADGSQQVNVTSDRESQHHPAWSPVPVDGSHRIAFTQDSMVNGYRTARIAMMRPDGTDRRALTAYTQGIDLTPAWRPDGHALIFTRSSPDVSADVYRLDLATGEERALLSLFDSQLTPVYSPNGRYIAFTSNHEPGEDRTLLPQIYTMRADGSRVVRRTATSPAKSNLAWRRVP